MIYRTLGATGLNVSILGLGCSGLGGVFGDVTEADAIHTLHTALEEGINYFDTAPFYGMTKSESVVGKALRGIARDRYILSSKVGRYGDADFDFSYARVKAGLEASLRRLGTGHLDIAILHDIEFVPLEEVLNKGLRALHDARAEGKIRFLAVSGLPVKIFPAILSQAKLDIALSYARYTLQNRTLEHLLPTFEQHKLGIINASPMALGLLTPQGAPEWHSASPAIKEHCRRAVEWCRANDRNIARIALQFSLANPRIHTTLAGAITAAQVRENARAVVEPTDPEALAALHRILSPVHNEMWPSGRPEYN